VQDDDSVVAGALQRDAVARRILAKGLVLSDHEVIGCRLNLNVLRSTGVLCHTIHKGSAGDGYKRGKGLFRNEVVAYLSVVLMRDVYFNVGQPQREKIALGTGPKEPMASIDGTYCQLTGKPHFSGVEVGFNPRTVHLFCDLEGYAIEYAQEVTVLGHRAYARGELRYFTTANAPQRAGTAITAARFKFADI
jgi:hypothetical protein